MTETNTLLGIKSTCASCGHPIIFTEWKIGRASETTQRGWVHEGNFQPRHPATPTILFGEIGVEQLRQPPGVSPVIEAQQSADDVATLAIVGALDLIEGAMTEAANKRAWRVLSLLDSVRDSIVGVQERLQDHAD